MAKALFRFYEELSDGLPPGQRKRDFEVSWEGKKTAREIIESLGVSSTQVDLVLVHGRSVDLEHVIEEGDRVSVYPVFERLNIQGFSRVREKPLRKPAFVVEKNLEAVASALKALGLDVVLDDDGAGEAMLPVGRAESRILLTGRQDLQGAPGLDRVIVLKPGSLQEQVGQVIEALDLAGDLGQEKEHERKNRGEASRG